MNAPIPRETVAYLAELSEHNSKAWFDTNRDRYQAELVEPAKALVQALGAELAGMAPGVHAEPRIDGSIFRIHRDTRFSKDKTPYKDHLDLFFWIGAGRSRERPGFYLRLTPTRLSVGAGKHGFDKAQLARYREAVADPQRGGALESALEEARAGGMGLGGETYRRVPKPWDSEHPRASLLKHSALFVDLDSEHPAGLHGPHFPSFCAMRMAPAAPLLRWLSEVI